MTLVVGIAMYTYMVADPKGKVDSIHVPPDHQAGLHRASLCLGLAFVQIGARTLIRGAEREWGCYIRRSLVRRWDGLRAGGLKIHVTCGLGYIVHQHVFLVDSLVYPLLTDRNLERAKDK